LLTVLALHLVAHTLGKQLIGWIVQSGWNNAMELSCYGDGQNVIPTIHVSDLAAYVAHGCCSSLLHNVIVPLRLFSCGITQNRVDRLWWNFKGSVHV